MISGGMKKTKLFCLCLLLFLKLHAVADESTDSTKVLAFADHLFYRGEYYRAITEYYRFQFSCPDCQKAPYAQWQISMAFQGGGQYADARFQAQDLLRRYPDSAEAKTVPVLIAASYRAEKKPGLAAIELDTFGINHLQKREGQEAVLLAGLQYLWANDNTSAKEILSELPKSSPLRPNSEALLREMNNLEALPQKNPLLAGSMSAVIPGAGQFYIGKKSDGFIAFVLNGVLLYATYSAFENDEYATGGVLAVLESGWYFGNIYNAMNGAHQYNRQQRESFLKNLDIQFTPVPSTRESSMGISAIFRF
jgi:TM2 domain-containing membrane protein YozV